MIVRAHAMGNQWQSVALLLPGRTNSDIKKRWGSKLHQQARSDQIVIIGDIESGDKEASVDCDHLPRSQAASTSDEAIHRLYAQGPADNRSLLDEGVYSQPEFEAEKQKLDAKKEASLVRQGGEEALVLEQRSDCHIPAAGQLAAHADSRGRHTSRSAGDAGASVALVLPGRTGNNIEKQRDAILNQQARSNPAEIVGDIESGDNEASADCNHPPRSQAASTSEELALSSDPGWQELDPEKVSKLRGSFARVLPQPASAREDAVGRFRPQHSPATIASTLQSNPGVGVDISSKPSGQKGCGTRISGAEIGHVSQVWIHENRRAFQQ